MTQKFTRLMLIAATAIACAAQVSAPTFSSPEDAKDALVKAAATSVDALREVLGTGSQVLLHTGDEVQDKYLIERFNQRAKEKSGLMTDAMNPNRVVVLFGEDDWPFPIPLKLQNGKWRFDLVEGKTEIRHRVIGGNELDAVEICHGYVEAQQIYSEVDRTGSGIPQYARKVFSSEGKKDGLYWPGDDSPVAAAIAKAVLEGYPAPSGKAAPYHGYFFKILTAQGPAADGGSRDYIVRGLMIGGFALVAWPAEYGRSGIMTFIVNQDGVVFEKDLGPQTGTLSKAMTKFNPDSSWQVTPES